jgi:hypothetical protein
MALTFSPVDSWDKSKRIHMTGTAPASGNNAIGGDTLDLSQTPLIASAHSPSRAASSGDGWGLVGYDYVFIRGTR